MKKKTPSSHAARQVFGLLALVALLFLTTPAPLAAEPTYKSYFTGDAADVSPVTQGGLLLVGGGEGYDDGMRWFVDRAGHGDIVVIRFSDSDYYNTWIYPFGPNSVETLLITSREAASDPYVLEQVRHAEGLFIGGGDQSNYVKNWKDTPLEDEINNVARRGGVVGGTSAGLAVLGNFVYSAMNGSLATTDALANPFHADLTMDRDFLSLPFLQNILTDSHFGIRDRMGRLIAMLARLDVDSWSSGTYGLGIDEGAALAVNELGIGQVVGAGGSAYLVHLLQAPERCVAGQSLEVRHVQVDKIVKGGTLDLKTLIPGTVNHYELEVSNGAIVSSVGSIY